MAVVTRFEGLVSIGLEPGRNFYVGVLYVDDLAPAIVHGDGDNPESFLAEVAAMHPGRRVRIAPLEDLVLTLELEAQGLAVIQHRLDRTIH